jgi:hypothetical protein
MAANGAGHDGAPYRAMFHGTQTEAFPVADRDPNIRGVVERIDVEVRQGMTGGYWDNVLHAGGDLHTNLFELQSKDVQKVPSSGKVSVDDKLGKCAAVRIVVCDDESPGPQTHIPSFPYDVGVHIENDEVLCAEPKDGASQKDRDGIDDVAINPVTRVVDGDRDPLIHEMARPARGVSHHGHTPIQGGDARGAHPAVHEINVRHHGHP